MIVNVLVNVRRLRWCVAGALMAVAMLAAPSVARADEDSLPSGEQVIEKSLEAMGGRAKLEAIKSRISVGSVELPRQNIKGSITIYEEYPNKNYTVAELEGAGKTESGCDGDVRWEISAMTGPRILEGEEKDFMERLGAIAAMTEWKRYYKEAKTSAIEDVNGRLHYRVALIPQKGQPVYAFYDKKTYLQSKVLVVAKGALGEVPLEVDFDDYRDTDGVLLPHRQTTHGAGIEQVLTIKSMKHNAQIPADRFKLPEPIKALVERAKTQKPVTTTTPAPAPATQPAKKP